MMHNPPKRHSTLTRNLPKRHQPSARNPPNETVGGQHPRAILSSKMVGAVPVCPPERPHSGVSIQKKYTHGARGMNDGCALTGRHGRAHRHRPYPTPPNHAVCHYRIAVILLIAQGWQVQRSLPWVTMQAGRLPPWGLYFFSSHILTTRGE